MEGREACLQTPVGGYSKCIYYLQSLREGSGRTDEFTRVSFRVFLQKLYSLICLSCHLSAYIIALIFFFSSLNFFKILAITEQKQSFTPTLPLFTQKEKDGPPHIAFCPDPRTRSLLHSSRRMTWDVKNVHLYINIISLCFFFSSVLAQQCSWTFFFFSRVWGISSKQAEKGETRVTILQVYDCSF